MPKYKMSLVRIVNYQINFECEAESEESAYEKGLLFMNDDSRDLLEPVHLEEFVQDMELIND